LNERILSKIYQIANNSYIDKTQDNTQGRLHHMNDGANAP